MAEDHDSSYETLSNALRGKTLEVYFTILRSGRGWTARELQRKLGFSSPSLVLYHLEKLKQIGLVETDREGLYEVTKIVRVGVLKYFVKIGPQLVPRFVFYSVFFAVIPIALFLTVGFTVHPVDITLVLVTGIASLLFLCETVWLLRSMGSS